MPDDLTQRGPEPDDQPTVRGLAAGRRVFGRYTLAGVLGRGGMGVVWRARDARLERDVALKFLPELVAGDAEAVRDLKSETKRCLELTHPNIVRVHDFVEEALLAAIAMEFVEGQSLAARKAASPAGCLTVDELAPLVPQLCAALDYAHGQAKVVHRDLKPANILLTRDGVVKITDFGIARSLSDTHTRLTGRAGDTSGTLAYMSPQQLLGGDPSPSDDIYALGATLYDLLTGKPPYYTGDLPLQIRDVVPKPLNERRAALGLGPVEKKWEQTIAACLAKAPADRPRTAGEVAAKLGLSPQSAGSPMAREMVAAVVGPGAAAVVGGPSANQVGTEKALGAIPPAPVRLQAAGRPRSRQGSRFLLWAGLATIAALAAAGYLFWPRASRAPAGGKPGGSSVASGPKPTVAPGGGGTAAAPIAPAPAPLPREFTVTVEPPDAGARLWLGPAADVEMPNGRTTVKNLSDGEQDLTVQAPGFQPFLTRVAVKDGRGSAKVKLVPVRGAVEVSARPGTQVTAVDERGRETRLGLVPASGSLEADDLLTVGRYTFNLEQADCAPVTVPNVELLVGRVARVAPTQTPLPGALRVFSVPEGADVQVNGRAVGQTPATLQDQPSEQPLEVEVSLRGYRRAEQAVTLKPRELRTVNVGTLSAESGTVELWIGGAAVQDDARFAVRIDGKLAEEQRIGPNEPLRIDGLAVGPRMIEVTHPNYAPWRDTVTVRDQQTTRVDATLRPLPGRLMVRSETPGIVLAVNGRTINASEIRDGEVTLPAGETLELEASAPGYQTVRRSLTLAPGGTQTWNVALKKKEGDFGEMPEEVRQILERAIAAHGGRESLSQFNSSRTEAMVSGVTNGRRFAMRVTVYSQLPDKLRVDQEGSLGRGRMPQHTLYILGDRSLAFTATRTGMVRDRMSPEGELQLREGLYISRCARLISLFEPGFQVARLPDRFESRMRVTPLRVRRNGEPDLTLLFDRENGLLVGIDWDAQKGVGQFVQAHERYGDFRRFLGVVFPTASWYFEGSMLVSTSKVLSFTPIEYFPEP